MSTARLSADRSTFLIVALAFASFVVLGFPGGMLGIAWPSIRDQFVLSQDRVGALLLASQIGYIISSFLSGRLTMAIGNGRLLTIGALLGGVGLLGYAMAPVWAVMVGIGMLVGFGGGALDSGMNAFFAMNFGPRLMNWLHASFGLGSTLGPILLTALLVGGLSWRWGYVTAAVAQVVIALAFLITRSRWRTTEVIETEGRPAASVQSVSAQSGGAQNSSREVTQFDILLGILVFFFIAGLEMTAGQWSFALFTESRDVELAMAGTWVSIYWGSFTAGRVFFGIFGNRFSVSISLRVSMLALLIASAMIWWPFSPWVSFLGLAIMGFGLAPLFPLLISATPARLGRLRAAHVIGYQVGAASLGIAILPWLVGYMAEVWSLEIVGPFLLVCSGVMLALYEWMERRSRR
ncbi:MFS transporter [bacterium]|nr:MFS transporter [bacterium]